MTRKVILTFALVFAFLANLAIGQVSTSQLTPAAPKGLPTFTIYQYDDGPTTPCDRKLEQGNWLNALNSPIPRGCTFPVEKFTWESLLSGALENFRKAPGSWRGTTHHEATVVVRGILQTPHHRIFDRARQFSYSFRRSTMRQIYQSPELRNAVYSWVMPQVKAEFQKMNAEDQQIYLEGLRYVEKYLEEFDYTAELQYYNDLAAAKCWSSAWRKAQGFNRGHPGWITQKQEKGESPIPCEELFTSHDRHGKPSDFRKLSAFAFRRFNQDSVGVETQLYWVRRAIQNLSTK